MKTTQSEHASRDGIERFLATLPLPALVVDWDLRLQFRNVSAREALARWSGTSYLKHAANNTRLPADLAQAVAEMKDEWQRARREVGVDTEPERLLSNPSGLVANLSTVPPPRGDFGKPSFVIRIASECASLTSGLAALALLSERQREVASLVAAGLANKEIATRLGRGLNTIKSELHEIFRRLGVHSRSQLILRLQESNGSNGE